MIIKLSHICAHVDPAFDIVEEELNNALPFGVDPSSFHFLRLYLVSYQKGRINNSIGDPFEWRFKALLLSDGVLTLTHRREEKLEASIFKGSAEGFAA